MKADKKNMLRISELAQKAGVSPATIKHYVNEGLIPKPVKTGKTMAYYDESSIDRIHRIKKLQKEKFLPLEVIRRMIDSGDTFEDDVNFGKAIFKQSLVSEKARPVPESKIERRCGYPLDHILALAEEGVVRPYIKDGVRYYDPIDVKIIEVMRRRGEMGIPFDHSLSTVRIYREAIEKAVDADVKLFTRSILGDVSTREAVKLMTEGDETLDALISLFRGRKARTISQNAIRSLDEIPGDLVFLNVLPLEGKELPDEAPTETFALAAYLAIKGDGQGAAKTLASAAAKEKKRLMPALIASVLAMDGARAAEALVEEHIPNPTARGLFNAAAALTYIFRALESPGFSEPIFLTKKAMRYLGRIGQVPARPDLSELAALYVKGGVFSILPDVLESTRPGVEILEAISELFQTGSIIVPEMEAWMRREIEFELLPAMEARTSAFLAKAYSRMGDKARASEKITRVAELSGPDSELVKWARAASASHGRAD